ncbi:hypothetical protein [Staphylococcus aureus]|uniref:hypothetical protein n=1 Tax=Staphylococcus aureus TaxID=1280 RepID=UPI000DE481A5|nr:hypothetical protein [Staphylococcus aureus]HDE3760455.1 hypothetical protein [Staphylococcus aureus]HDE6087088.1 hypothetical protein [Staphylococcus aureus]HDE7633313.1 hypothetical protein [Staphylococcus aureus]HDE8127308.1 hypothetical protein [Staphylococcus aureus]HDF0634969.1 hypothetical protein [Staphylococcus aureus]
MNKIDKLQETVNKAFGESAVILDSTDDLVLVKYEKGEHVEYASLKHNYDSVFFGHYYSTFGQTKDEAAKNAWAKHEKRIDGYA